MNGGNGHISKPLDENEIGNIIKSTLGEIVEEPTEEFGKKFVDNKVVLRIAEINITDHLTLGILENKIEIEKFKPKYVELETYRMPGWNPLQKKIEKNEVDAAFIIAPITMDSFAFNVPIKLISLAHKNGSSFLEMLIMILLYMIP